ncbi:dioxygenase [Streptomyces sp. NPDC096354]|uniref:dioxygenase family protein n=1 Tax=Streptomyces sp. NPDC096354 TaxID=3366088 RepID=UPI0037F48AB8
MNPDLATSPATTTSEQISANVLAEMGRPRNQRIGEVMQALTRHLHDFAREVRLQPDELLAAADFLTRCGQISDDTRHEFLLLSDTLGLTMLVDTLATEVPDGALESSVLGPFYRADAPMEANGTSIVRGGYHGEATHLHGRVLDMDGKPIAGAVLDIWSTNDQGRYENLDPNQPDFNLRGRFTSDAEGNYDLWSVKPVSYSIPADGPAGELLKAMDRHNMRPAHVHVIASAPGYRTVVSELFTDDDPYLDSDVVFGVKSSLVVHYNRVSSAEALSNHTCDEPYWDLDYDFILVPGETATIGFSTTRAADAPSA